MNSSVKCPISKGMWGDQAAPQNTRMYLHSRQDQGGYCSSPSYLASWEDCPGAGGALEVSLAQPRSALILH